ATAFGAGGAAAVDVAAGGGVCPRDHQPRAPWASSPGEIARLTPVARTAPMTSVPAKVRTAWRISGAPRFRAGREKRRRDDRAGGRRRRSSGSLTRGITGVFATASLATA